MKKIIFFIIFLFLSLSLFGEELYRIRITNSENGLVQVSLDGGNTYYATGLVKQPAGRASQGFMASGYINGGCVCAAASHAIRIKVFPKEKYNEDFKNVSIFSVTAKEFWTDPKGFGGYSSPNSSILTDIHTATGIFSNFAPFPDTQVYSEEKGKLIPIDDTHEVSEGNVYVIPVERPETEDTFIEFENTPGGSVLLNNSKITEVFKPFKGIGRYDGTTYNSPGQINTAHGGVITIATSPLFSYKTKEGGKTETRGGFMIQPVRHAFRQTETKPQVMTVGKDQNETEQEGKAPLYSKNIGLWFYLNYPEHSYYAEPKIDSSYIKMPSVTGKNDNAFTKEYLNGKLGIKCGQGLTGVRIHIPKFSRELSEKYLNYICGEFEKEHRELCRNTDRFFTPNLNISSDLYCLSYYTDGVFCGIINNPEDIKIDTEKYYHGLHSLLVVAETAKGMTIKFSENFFSK